MSARPKSVRPPMGARNLSALTAATPNAHRQLSRICHVWVIRFFNGLYGCPGYSASVLHTPSTNTDRCPPARLKNVKYKSSKARSCLTRVWCSPSLCYRVDVPRDPVMTIRFLATFSIASIVHAGKAQEFVGVDTTSSPRPPATGSPQLEDSTIVGGVPPTTGTQGSQYWDDATSGRILKESSLDWSSALVTPTRDTDPRDFAASSVCVDHGEVDKMGQQKDGGSDPSDSVAASITRRKECHSISLQNVDNVQYFGDVLVGDPPQRLKVRRAKHTPTDENFSQICDVFKCDTVIMVDSDFDHFRTSQVW